MNIPPSELWEMDGPELIFWIERLEEISKSEREAAKDDS